MFPPAPCSRRSAKPTPNANPAKPLEASHTLETLLESPDFTQRARVEAYLTLGKCYDQLGRRRSAQACYRRILALTDDWTYRRGRRRRYFRQAFRPL